MDAMDIRPPVVSLVSTCSQALPLRRRRRRMRSAKAAARLAAADCDFRLGTYSCYAKTAARVVDDGRSAGSTWDDINNGGRRRNRVQTTNASRVAVRVHDDTTARTTETEQAEPKNDARKDRELERDGEAAAARSRRLFDWDTDHGLPRSRRRRGRAV
ncbi:unnamed protein product [Macrosiphum euphorbiae]|uniref:Uncharacterized protein n=1 Tax=Macrosiphum euphorbiae TaxID=13131 RepID=A0AAV0Y9I5_9HEMI|nr:unnamed protein product [Macrosiphum euphorbiae]